MQDHLEAALQSFARSPIRTQCAGRTDAGVHALEQVVHFDTELNRDMFSWVRGVNAFLPSSIAVRWAANVSGQDANGEPFHARFSAFSRTYQYVIYNHPVRSALWSQRAGWVFRPLDVELMQQGAQYLLGTHDFTSFRAAQCQAKSPVKTMHEIEIARQGDVLILTITASAFLHHMVRNIVGSLNMIGTGNKPPEWMGEILALKDRSRAAPTFMPDGLYLAKIGYDPAWELPQESGALPFG